MNQPYSYPYGAPTPPRPRSTSPLVWIFAIGAVILLLGTCVTVAGIGAFATFVSTLDDPGGVQLGAQVSEAKRAKLRERGLIDDKTQLIAFYDGSIGLNLSEVSILTSEDVVYSKDNKTVRAKLSEVTSVDHREEVGNDVMEIATTNGARLRIEVAPFNGGVAFLNALEDELHKQSPSALVRRKTPR